MRRLLATVSLLAACLTEIVAMPAKAQISAATLAQANAALQDGEADKALSVLTPLPSVGAGAAEAQNLLCRVRITLAQSDPAVQACQKAVNLDIQNSTYHMWLGRALGDKARDASFFSAYGLGKQVRSEFEEAVRLDPHNAAALSDLGDFYNEAPGVIGGGSDKAKNIANQLEKVEPARAYQLRGRIAESSDDYGTAERELQKAISASAHPASQWTVLASFYRRRKRWSDLEFAIHSCVSAAAHDKHPGVALYDGAGVLIESKRDSALAARMLEDYLAGSSKSEEAPAFIAHIRLGRLKKQLGDITGAQREFEAASAMAREYNPAQDSKH